RIAERFFNMWLIVTQGNPDQKRRARYLTLFLESWYDGQELKALTQEHLEHLREGTISYDKAMVLSKGLAQSKFIGVEERDVLIDYTLKLNTDSLRDSELPRKYESIKKEIVQFWSEHRYVDALTRIEEIENEDDGVKFFLKAYCFTELNKSKEAERYYLQAIEKGHIGALNSLAILYAEQGKIPKAETYFLQAIEKDYVDASYNLAVLYYEQDKISEAESYYLQAIEKGHIVSLYNLANLYAKQVKITEAETYYLQAVERGHVISMYNLAILYFEKGRSYEAERYFLQAIEKGYVEALYNLAGLYYMVNKNPKAAIEYAHQYFAKTADESRFKHLVIFEIWNGIFDNLSEKIERVIQNSQDDDLTWFLTNLLCHEQKQLVLSLFESAQHGKMLRDRYELLYYATLILAQKTDDNLLLKIPPEVLPTVQEIVEKVKEKQAFYAV
ncbi:MAG TPA: tetratricopeptide repeat protein, partial [Saprospiraceae bacterium]|nr:tetratricopeptide repeat protein [Saprospiraceae bacterium]